LTLQEEARQGVEAWAQKDSNLQPTDYESAALTVELWAHRIAKMPVKTGESAAIALRITIR
jgi:hypothetical protein